MATADLSAIDAIARALRTPGCEPVPPDWKDAVTAHAYAEAHGITDRAANYILIEAWRKGTLERRQFRLTPGIRPAYLYRPVKKARQR